MTTQSVPIRSEGLTLARVIWQVLKRQPAGYMEKVLEVNPGLAALGPILPVGTVVVLPIDAIPTVQATRPLVRLWD